MAKLVQALDLERHRRIQAERKAQALRMVIARLRRQEAATGRPGFAPPPDGGQDTRAA
jgi:phage protein D